MGKTKRGKASKVMPVADRAGLPIAVSVASASPDEVTLVNKTLTTLFVRELPETAIGNKAYDSDPLDAELGEQDIELIAPHGVTGRSPPLRLFGLGGGTSALGRSTGSLPGSSSSDAYWFGTSVTQ